MIRSYTSKSFEKDTVGQWASFLTSQMQWPVSFESVPRDSFEADISRFDFGGLSMCSHTLSPSVIVRKAVEDESDRHFRLNLITRGRLVVEHCGRRNVLGKWDIVLADNSRPTRLVIEETIHVVTVLIPSACLRSHIPNPEDFCNRVLGKRHNFTRPLQSTLLSLFEMGRQELSQETCERSIQPFLGLLGFAFLTNYSYLSEGKSCKLRRLDLIRQYIDDNLTDPNLGPDVLAAHFRLSCRYLRKLFALEGDTVSKYIQRRRLEKSAERISNKLWKDRSITDISFHFGFNSAPHFTRAFKAQFGMTPKEYRKRAISQ